jgi:hypothetical protein
MISVYSDLQGRMQLSVTDDISVVAYVNYLIFHTAVDVHEPNPKRGRVKLVKSYQS